MFSKLKRLKYRKYKNCTIIENALVDKLTSIGEYTYIGHNCIITKSTIGRYCSIAPMVTIGLGEHDIYKISTSSLFYENDVYSELTKNDVNIGNDVWIGTKATILRGVNIGNGAVIGANAVVTSDIPDFAVAVGCPARIIKFRFTPEEIDIINKSNCWNKEIIEAKMEQRKIEEKLKYK